MEANRRLSRRRRPNYLKNIFMFCIAFSIVIIVLSSLHRMAKLTREASNTSTKSPFNMNLKPLPVPAIQKVSTKSMENNADPNQSPLSKTGERKLYDADDLEMLHLESDSNNRVKRATGTIDEFDDYINTTLVPDTDWSHKLNVRNVEYNEYIAINETLIPVPNNTDSLLNSTFTKVRIPKPKISFSPSTPPRYKNFKNIQRQIYNYNECLHQDPRFERVFFNKESSHHSGDAWNKSFITYKIRSYPKSLNESSTDKIVADSFKVWSRWIPLTFTQIKGCTISSDIDILFLKIRGNHMGSVIFTHGYSPRNFIYIKDQPKFRSHVDDPGEPLSELLVYVIGRILGLPRTNTEYDSDSVMSALLKFRELQDKDVCAITWLYAPKYSMNHSTSDDGMTHGNYVKTELRIIE